MLNHSSYELKKYLAETFTGESLIKAQMLLEEIGPGVFNYHFSCYRWENLNPEKALEKLWERFFRV